MSDDEVTIAMSIPLDSDGFVRHECPTCEREFKSFSNRDDDDDISGAEPVLDGGYFCLYCGVQAPADGWLTQAQLALAQNIIEKQVMGPTLKGLGKDIENIGRRSGGLITATTSYDEPDGRDALTEADDIRRVDFECHPSEPLKVADDWTKPVRCLICGNTFG